MSNFKLYIEKKKISMPTYTQTRCLYILKTIVFCILLKVIWIEIKEKLLVREIQEY